MFVVFGIPNAQASIFLYSDSIVQHSDSANVQNYKAFDVYLGIGFPFGIGAEFAYRPLSSIAFILAGNKGLPILYSIDSRFTACVGFAIPIQPIDSEGFQHAVSASLVIFQKINDINPTFYSVALYYGMMPCSLPVFNWKLGVLIYPKDEGSSTFFHGAAFAPIIFFSWRIF
jgi:hypothetical protein